MEQDRRRRIASNFQGVHLGKLHMTTVEHGLLFCGLGITEFKNQSKDLILQHGERSELTLSSKKWNFNFRAQNTQIFRYKFKYQMPKIDNYS